MPDRSVLVVEDDDTLRQLLTEVLKSDAGVEVESARDGVEALHQISTKRYGVVVLDIVMPKMSGVDFLDSLAALREQHSLQPLPAVLVITSMPDGEIADRELANHCPELVRGVFRKPLDADALAEEVRRHLR